MGNKVKIGSGKLEIPEEYTKLDPMPDDPKGSVAFGLRTENASCFLLFQPLKNSGAMPYDHPEKVIDGIHHALDEDQALIEVSAGKTKSGKKFIYSIVKSKQQPSGVLYTLTMHVNMGFLKDSVWAQCFFAERGTTGVRDSMIYAAILNEGKGKVDFWMADPYDPELKGFQMNQSEKAEYDHLFPNHPLTCARRFVSDLAALN